MTEEFCYIESEKVGSHIEIIKLCFPIYKIQYIEKTYMQIFEKGLEYIKSTTYKAHF